MPYFFCLLLVYFLIHPIFRLLCYGMTSIVQNSIYFIGISWPFSLFTFKFCSEKHNAIANTRRACDCASHFDHVKCRSSPLRVFFFARIFVIVYLYVRFFRGLLLNMLVYVKAFLSTVTFNLAFASIFLKQNAHHTVIFGFSLRWLIVHNFLIFPKFWYIYTPFSQ